MPSRWFTRGAVASPHHLASAAGARVLADGGNAVDAAVAANLVLAVVTPYHCGLGGDLLAIVHDGAVAGVSSIGAMPAGASAEQLHAAIAAGHGSEVAFPGTGGMPALGALPVTVPGAVAGWWHLLEGWGTRTFGELSTAARHLAHDGFAVSPYAAAHVERARPALGSQPGWEEAFGRMRAGTRFVQAELSATLTMLAHDGPDAFYRGPLATRIVEVLGEHGSAMSLEDLATHRAAAVDPLRGGFRGRTVLELPPPTQGVTALTALAILDQLPPRPPDDGGREVALAWHHEVEAVRLALRDRQHHLGDPGSMRRSPAELLAADRVAGLAADVDDDRRLELELDRPMPGGTAYLCAADGDGMVVSLIQSNLRGFGSGVVVPGAGFGLHDRGAHLRLDAPFGEPNAVGPGVRPLHTLIPAMTLTEAGGPDLVFGTMGGDAQPQVHVQLLRRWLDAGADLQDAIDAPRFVVGVGDGVVTVEERTPQPLVDALRARGHEVRRIPDGDPTAGHAHVLRVRADGLEGASDPRSEGAVVGW